VDGKAIYIRGQEAALVDGVNQDTRDVVHAVGSEIEGEEAFERLVREAVTEAGYPLKGLVMDAAAPFLAALPFPCRGARRCHSRGCHLVLCGAGNPLSRSR
jgi:hypothetical protein